jgi:hypothetical protein
MRLLHSTLRTAALLLGLLLVTLSCGPRAPDTRRNQMTQRQRDSVLGASQLPGATGVRGALRAGDSAAARRAREDSISQ